MNKKLKIPLRTIWLVINFVLLTLFAISSFTEADNIFGVSGTLLLLLSFPCNLLIGWLFFAFGNFYALPGAMLLMMIACSFVGYFQWFILIPHLTNIFRRKFHKHDLKVVFNVNVESTKQISEPTFEDNTQEWKSNWYDEREQTPVERVFNRDQKGELL